MPKIQNISKVCVLEPSYLPSLSPSSSSISLSNAISNARRSWKTHVGLASSPGTPNLFGRSVEPVASTTRRQM